MGKSSASFNYDFDKYIGRYITDIFMSLSMHGRFEEMEHEAKNAIANSDIGKWITSIGVAEAQKISDSWIRSLKIEKVKSFNTEVLEAFNLSPEGFLDLIALKTSRRKGGHTKHKETPKQKVIAAYIFHDAHKNNQTRAKAIDRVGNELTFLGFNKPATSRTISAWLDELNHLLTKERKILPKSNRGKKKIK